MLIGLTLRFLQDTFWYRNIWLMRISGLCIAATILPFLLLGMYASLGIGQNDQYFMDHKWFGFIVPVLASTYMIVMDEKNHFVFFIDPAEQQPNLSFHPGKGFFVLFTIGYVMMILRVLIIYSRNKNIHGKGIMRIVIPFFEPIVMTLFTLDYFLFSLGIVPWLEGKEILELYAKIYLVEILTWEFYIFMGLVPVNMEYRSILENATVGMQILSSNEKILSRSAVPISPEVMKELEKSGFVTLEDGKELHIQALSDGNFLWYTDTSRFRKTIEDLENSAEQLSQQSTLLEEELRAGNNLAKTQAQNRIYDELISEVSVQLQKMKELIHSQDSGDDDIETMRKLCLLGTYVKRRCNLQLIRLGTGTIDPMDMRISLEDMARAANNINIRASVNWNPSNLLPSDFYLFVLDTLERVLEYEDFGLREIRIETIVDRAALEIHRFEGNHPKPAYQVADGQYPQVTEDLPDGYRITLTAGGDRHV
ncbi:MAG: hypothetical protein IJ126_00410 [Lachnospiraceae bacterium]|nr:hypothetical protein [Lachnospiraceae bacterium]